MFGENGNAGHRRFGVPEPDLETAYEAAHEEARNLLAQIEELLCDMPAPGSEDCPIDWTPCWQRQRGQSAARGNHGVSGGEGSITYSQQWSIRP